MAETSINLSADAPIGIFDSGIGGLSVLRHVRALLPAEAIADVVRDEKLATKLRAIAAAMTMRSNVA